MGCTCSIDVDCDEYTDRYWIKNRKARSVHKCDECGGRIEPGEVYEHAKLLQEQEFAVFKTCKICLEIRKCYFCSWLYTSIWEDLREELRWTDDIKLCMLDHLGHEARDVMIDFIDELLEEEVD